jgi:hypothetical protein
VPWWTPADGRSRFPVAALLVWPYRERIPDSRPWQPATQGRESRLGCVVWRALPRIRASTPRIHPEVVALLLYVTNSQVNAVLKRASQQVVHPIAQLAKAGNALNGSQ